jgi:hypothetical protein
VAAAEQPFSLLAGRRIAVNHGVQSDFYAQFFQVGDQG